MLVRESILNCRIVIDGVARGENYGAQKSLPTGNQEMATPLPGIVRMGLIKRLPSLTPAAFTEHWSGPHGAFAARLPNLRRYYQNHTMRPVRIGKLTDPWELDGLSELWFDSLELMKQAIASPSYGDLAGDTPTVMIVPGVVAGPQEAAVAMRESAGASVKAMVVVKRRGDLSSQQFLAGWHDATAQLAGVDGLLGVTNTIVIYREGAPREELAYDALPVDAVTEFWFTADRALRSTLERPDFTSRAERLCESASSYVVQTYLILP
jgi:uncharacterized protein (TIGR02118 family)